jgi:hypothetical protein
VPGTSVLPKPTSEQRQVRSHRRRGDRPSRAARPSRPAVKDGTNEGLKTQSPGEGEAASVRPEDRAPLSHRPSPISRDDRPPAVTLFESLMVVVVPGGVRSLALGQWVERQVNTHDVGPALQSFLGNLICQDRDNRRAGVVVSCP